MLKRMKLKYAMGFGIVLMVLVAGIALAQGALPHFVPQEVEKLPDPWPAVTPPPPHSTPRWMTLEEIERRAGFSLVLPKYLPPGCSPLERFYEFRTAGLTFTCVAIIEQRAQGVARPYVGKGSVQEVSIRGQPALWIDGTWKTDSNWVPGRFPALIFERNDLVIMLRAWPSGTSKEELIKIAESML